jgi:transcriptional regulator with XRE-family HTH domain
VGAAILLRLADALDASLDYLMRGDEDSTIRRSITVSPQLSAAAEREGWSHSQTLAVLQAREMVIARRGGIEHEKATRQWTTQQWIDFHGRLFGGP